MTTLASVLILLSLIGFVVDRVIAAIDRDQNLLGSTKDHE